MTWNVGDLAVCVDARRNPTITRPGNIELGCVYRVAGVILRDRSAPHALFGSSAVCLILEGKTNSSKTGGFAEQRFRRVTPDKHEACDTEFVTLLKRSKVRAGIVRDLIFTMGRVAR